jgi:hypothetical protein
MLAKDEISNLEKTGRELLTFVLNPNQWVALNALGQTGNPRPGKNPKYQRKLGPVRICASVDVASNLCAFLRVAFWAPGLTPADYLEAFLKGQIPLLPNAEWQVTVDAQKWIHFIHRYTGEPLRA